MDYDDILEAQERADDDYRERQREERLRMEAKGFFVEPDPNTPQARLFVQIAQMLRKGSHD